MLLALNPSNFLLQKKGVDPEDLEKKLTSLQVKSVEQMEYLEETDIEVRTE